MGDIGFKAIFAEEVTMTVSQGSDMDMPMQWLVDTVAVPFITDGWDARAQLRSRPGSTIWLSLTTTADANGNVITLEDDGRITIHIDHLETEGTAWDAASRAEGRWDLEMIDPTGSPQRLVMGPVKVSQDVTRAI